VARRSSVVRRFYGRHLSGCSVGVSWVGSSIVGLARGNVPGVHLFLVVVSSVGPTRFRVSGSSV